MFYANDLRDPKRKVYRHSGGPTGYTLRFTEYENFDVILNKGNIVVRFFSVYNYLGGCFSDFLIHLTQISRACIFAKNILTFIHDVHQIYTKRAFNGDTNLQLAFHAAMGFFF